MRSAKFVMLCSFVISLLWNIGTLSSMAAEEQLPPPVPVVVAEVEEHRVRQPITVVGNVEPDRVSLVASEVAGYVENMLVEEGQFVKKGDVFLEFRTQPIEIRLREARAAKLEAEARFELASKNLVRIQELYKKGVASLQQLQDAESEKKAWAGRVDQLQAQIERYLYDLSRARVLAPFNGYITKQHAEIGQWVGEGGAVVELIDIDNVEIEVDFPERYVNEVKVGDRVYVSFDALPGVKVEGKVLSIVPQADLNARTFPVKVGVENKEHIIKSGMVARVSFLVGEPVVSKFVPKDAIVERDNLRFVFVVENGIVKPVPVNTGISYKSLIEVFGPVNVGELVVIRGNERLRPGQPVNVVKQDGIPVR
jgi:HlyD family secretion protein